MVNKARWQTLRQEAWEAKRNGHFEQSRTLFQASIDEVQDHTHDLEDLCLTLNGLADLHVQHGELEKAIEIARSIVATRRSIAGKGHILLGNDLMFLAMVLEEAGRYEEALPFAEEGAGIYLAEMGAEHYEAKRMYGIMERIRASAIAAKKLAAQVGA